MLYQELLDEKRKIAVKVQLTDQEMRRLRHLNDELDFYASPWIHPTRDPFMDMTPEQAADRKALAMAIVKEIIAKHAARERAR